MSDLSGSSDSGQGGGDSSTPMEVIRVTTSPVSSSLTVRDFVAWEYVGRPFLFEVQLVSGDPSIAFTDMLGNHLLLELDLPTGDLRYRDGVVTQFTYIGEVEGGYAYQATLRPWFWLLTRNIQTKIYQNKTVLDIIKDVFNNSGFDQFDDQTGRKDYVTYDYCVQYQESDFAFAHRLMEREGIYYYFTHDETSGHKLVIADGPSSHSTFPGSDDFATIPYVEDGQEGELTDFVSSWIATQEIQSGLFTIRDFDFEKPSANLDKNKAIADAQSYGDFEIYEYPGKYIAAADGETYAGLRMEEQAAQYARGIGRTTARWIAAGSLLTLSGAARDDQNCEYLVLETKTTFRREKGRLTQSLETNFRAMPTAHNFRMPRETPLPHIRGPQTAIVTGKSGEEIWTDKYARIKVQFHWDRYGNNDESSSCWIRCAQPWAGKQWGTVFIPRIGQEVVVHFIEGDPDQPIITGAVYNGPDDQPSPITLPDNATQSTIKTNSSKGGNGFNQLRFEDLAGSEEIYVHAQKDYNIEVLNNRNITVTQDLTETVTQGNRSITVSTGNETKEITKGNQSLTIDQGNRSIKVGQGTETTSIYGDTSLTVTSGNHTVEVSQGNHKMTIDTGNHTIEVSLGSSSLKAMQGITIESTTSITLKVAENTITISNQGVAIKGLMVSAEGTVQTEVKGLMTSVKADAMLQMQGSVTMIG